MIGDASNCRDGVRRGAAARFQEHEGTELREWRGGCWQPGRGRDGAAGHWHGNGAAGVGAGDHVAEVVHRVVQFVRVAGVESGAGQVDGDGIGQAPVVNGDVGAAGFIGVGPHDDFGAGRGAGGGEGVVRVGGGVQAAHSPAEIIAVHGHPGQVRRKQRSADDVVVLHDSATGTAGIAEIEIRRAACRAGDGAIDTVVAHERILRDRIAADEQVATAGVGGEQSGIFVEDVAVDGEVVHAGRSAAVSLHAVVGVVEDNVVEDFLIAREILGVDPMAVTAVRRVPAVVVDQAAVGFEIGISTPQAEAQRIVVNNEVDELIARAGVGSGDGRIAVNVGWPRAGLSAGARGAGTGDFEAPVPSVRTGQRDGAALQAGAVKRGAFARVLADDDRSGAGTGQFRAKQPLIGTATQPDCVAGFDSARLVQGRLQIPRAGSTAVTGRTAGGCDVELCCLCRQ